MISRLADQSEDILYELPKGSEFRKNNKGNLIFHTERSATDFQDEDTKRRWISETLNAYANALRPRLKGAA